MDRVSASEAEGRAFESRRARHFDEHIAWIAQNPEVPRLRPGGYRRVNLKIFPYYIPHIIRDPVIWILAIAHGHRRPKYWVDRPKAID
jgi:hypothetical protein